MVKLNDIIDDPVAAALEHAALLIEDGWCKEEEHKLIGKKHHFCAIGAMRVAAGATIGEFNLRTSLMNITLYRDMERLVVDSLKLKCKQSRDCDSITGYNDFVGRKRGVVALLRRAARKRTVKPKVTEKEYQTV